MFDGCCKIPPPYKAYALAENALSIYCTILSKRGFFGGIVVGFFCSLCKKVNKKKKPHQPHSCVHRSLNLYKEGIYNTVGMKTIKYNFGKLGY